MIEPKAAGRLRLRLPLIGGLLGLAGLIGIFRLRVRGTARRAQIS